MSILTLRAKPVLLFTTATLLLAGAVFAAARSQPPATSAGNPLQVADTLDSIVQPRFQQSAGRFGMDRVVIGGHDNIYDLIARTPAEKRKLRWVNATRRPYVLAFLHCTHKPGRNVGAQESESRGAFQPYLSVLAAATMTQAGSEKIDAWANMHLGKLVTPSLPQLRGNGDVQTVQLDYGNWLVVMRPVRAHSETCLGCHAGAKRGDTLGVMVYAVDKNVNSNPSKSLFSGGGV